MVEGTGHLGDLEGQWSLLPVVSMVGTDACFRAGSAVQTTLFCAAVIDGLDLLKKEHAGARDGIRYLEAEFKKGNR